MVQRQWTTSVRTYLTKNKSLCLSKIGYVQSCKGLHHLMSTKYYLVLDKLKVRLLLVCWLLLCFTIGYCCGRWQKWWVSCGERSLSGQRSVYALWGAPLWVARPYTLDWCYCCCTYCCLLLCLVSTLLNIARKW